MLKFVGDIGLYHPERDSIGFTALDGRLVVGCWIRRSALQALGCSGAATADELVGAFQSVRKFLERIVRYKWHTGRIARGTKGGPLVLVEDADIYLLMGRTEELELPDGYGNDTFERIMANGAGRARPRFSRDPLRILVVEDNLLTADAIQDQLEISGCEVVGPSPDIDSSLALIARSAIDGAVLDVTLGKQSCFPIAAALTERAIPFVFLTGDDDKPLPPEYRPMRRLSKPSDMPMLAEIVSGCFGQASRATH